jgi:hypothetical protein
LIASQTAATRLKSGPPEKTLFCGLITATNSPVVPIERVTLTAIIAWESPTATQNAITRASDINAFDVAGNQLIPGVFRGLSGAEVNQEFSPEVESGRSGREIIVPDRTTTAAAKSLACRSAGGPAQRKAPSPSSVNAVAIKPASSAGTPASTGHGLISQPSRIAWPRAGASRRDPSGAELRS